MLTIRTQLVSGLGKTYGGINPVEFITVHETANRTIGADARAHANLQSKGNVRNASWHYQVDDTEAVQSFDDRAQCWHAGDGRGPGNLKSIAIEICVNADGDFVKAVANAATLVARLQKEHDVPNSNVVQHHFWSGKECPRQMRSGLYVVNWTDFKRLVVAGGAVATPTPTKPPAAKEKDLMSKLPDLDWRQQSTKYDAFTERIQGLLKAADCYPGVLDGRRGPLTLQGLGKFQRAYNCGNGQGGSDLRIGARTWESLLFWKRWPR